MKNVSSIAVEDALDISDAKADVERTVELKPYLPDGVTLADSTLSGEVSVTAKIEEEKVRILEIPVEQITLTNVPEGYKAKLRGLEDTVTVKLAGLASQVDEIEAAELIGTVDVAEYLLQMEEETITTGSYYPSASFTLPEYVYLKEKVKIHIVLEEK